ncbi:MAG: paraquat-inducible protein A [Myxococcota bacterium]
MIDRHSALGASHIQCQVCSLVMSLPEPVLHARIGCSRCGASVHRRKPNSLIRTWAFLIAAVIFYIPANLYPIMQVTTFGYRQSNTILSGVQYFILDGMWPLALIVFVASVVVPVVKIGLLSALVLSVQRRSQWSPRNRVRLYRMVEIVGRWSMVDIYVVAVLIALVHLGSLASIEVEQGALFFGVVVVLTLLAAQSFDPRLIWDQIEDDDE